MTDKTKELLQFLFPEYQIKACVETVCLLSKLKDADHKVKVTLDMDELDVTAAEAKATCEEIKTYILEHSGFKVVAFI